MADQEEDDLQMALRMSLQQAPDPKRSKPRESLASSPAVGSWEKPQMDGHPLENSQVAGKSLEKSHVDGIYQEESPESRNRRVQRELMAAAAEKRMMVARNLKKEEVSVGRESVVPENPRIETVRKSDEGLALSNEDAHQLYYMVFGASVSKDILAQWCNQGIRFSTDPETCMGLVQHEGGPCGVLAAIQAFVLRNLLFYPDESSSYKSNMQHQHNFGLRRFLQIPHDRPDNVTSLSENEKARALVLSMVEILFLCGSKKQAAIATLNVLSNNSEEICKSDEKIAKALEGLSMESASDLQKAVRIHPYTSQKAAVQRVKEMLPVFQSRMGAMLFLISALLSRGLEAIQSDRDDPGLPLVTAPFGHASQEIVNLLLCGQAVPNVFDGSMDLGGGMSLKGIPTSVEVGFLTLLESLNFCKVGHYLKCPKWPIWVIGSESHYTVLFALDVNVQEENKLEERESRIRKAFDSQDQSGGGGFISSEAFQQVLRETNISIPPEKLEALCNSGFIVWNEFWQVLLQLDESSGGLKDSTGLMGRRQFDLYHFNGIAKSVQNSGSLQGSGGEALQQRPRLSKIRVTVPPKWTPEEFMSDMVGPSSSSGSNVCDGVAEVTQPDPPQHAPLVDCVRTWWPRAVCNWVGDPPSIV
ncbi:hypothetical protein AMTRI_Chr11g151730 [Amborella trichopoda]